MARGVRPSGDRIVVIRTLRIRVINTVTSSFSTVCGPQPIILRIKSLLWLHGRPKHWSLLQRVTGIEWSRGQKTGAGTPLRFIVVIGRASVTRSSFSTAFYAIMMECNINTHHGWSLYRHISRPKKVSKLERMVAKLWTEGHSLVLLRPSIRRRLVSEAFQTSQSIPYRIMDSLQCHIWFCSAYHWDSVVWVHTGRRDYDGVAITA